MSKKMYENFKNAVIGLLLCGFQLDFENNSQNTILSLFYSVYNRCLEKIVDYTKTFINIILQKNGNNLILI